MTDQPRTFRDAGSEIRGDSRAEALARESLAAAEAKFGGLSPAETIRSAAARLRADLVALGRKDPDVRTLYAFEAGMEEGRIEAKAEVARLQAYIDTQPYRDEWDDLAADRDEARRVIAAVEALAEAWDKSGAGTYAAVLRAALSGGQP